MRIYITGASGFIGNHLYRYFLGKGHSVFPFIRGNRIETIGVYKPNVVIHCAAEVKNPDLMVDSNILLTHRVLEQCRKLDSLESVIYLGSSSEYGRKSHPMCETDVLEPDSMYEATKACGTMLTRAYAKTYGLPTNIIRPFSVYGPKEASNRFIPTIYSRYVDGGTMKINNGVHDFIYIDDFIEGLVAVISKKNKIPGDVINLGTAIQTTNEEVVKTFSKVVGKEIKYEMTDMKLAQAGIDSNMWVCDTFNARVHYGWSSKISLEQGIEKYVQYRKSNEENTKSI